MSSTDLTSTASEHLLVRRHVEGGTDPGTDGSAQPRPARGGGRGDLTGGVRRLAVGTERMSDTTVVSVAGEIDLATTERFAQVLRSHLNDGAPTVVIDLTDVSFASIHSVRVLLTALRQARRRGVLVRVVPSLAVRRIITFFGATAECEAS